MAQLKTSSIIPMPCASFEWKGSGGLKAGPGTTEEDSRVNLELCNTILLDADIKILYGVYQVEGAGQVTLYKTKGRKHISNIMCSSRKPSAYQQQCSKDSSRKRACKGKAEEPNGNVPTKVQKVDLQTEVTVILPVKYCCNIIYHYRSLLGLIFIRLQVHIFSCLNFCYTPVQF
ncbi:uncharacterized protein [Montipora foliosa]|uniref:uncharacterized protein isoform X1 n=1 Tax=Montipora foliosa TaxID=591990 RepID=UPI0035F17271